MTRSRVAAALLAVIVPAVVQPLGAQSSAPPPGRLLASNCFQCHGTNGRGGFERLAGKSASDIYNDLKDMQRKPPGENLMFPHARGYTDAQLRALAAYLASVR